MNYLIGIVLLLGSFSDSICADVWGDADAKLILDKVSENYLSFESIAIDFTLTIALPEKPISKEVGRIVQKGKSFKLEMKEQDIYCDGKSLWYYLKDKNEVQINDYEGDEDVGVLSPMDLLKQYQKGEYEYRLVSQKGGVAQIEFKPNDGYSDYSKLRLYINTEESNISRVKAFAKDGSEFTFVIDEEFINKTYPSTEFSFDTAAFPEVTVEDLRID